MLIQVTGILLYALVLVGIGIISWRRSSSYAGYNVAGRSNNKWVAAVSHQASSASAWLLMGLPGAAYLMGFGIIWTLLGWIAGSLINWFILAKRLRTATEHYDASTIFDLFAKRTGDSRGVVLKTAALVLVIILVVNSSAELLAIGTLLSFTLGLEMSVGVFIGALVVVAYTAVGGFQALSWANLLQGTMMVLALIAVPIAAVLMLTSSQEAEQPVYSDVDDSFFSVLGASGGGWEPIAFMSLGLGIALMFPGYVHALPSLLSIKNPRDLMASGLIATLWGVFALVGAATVGLLGRALVPDIDNPETILVALADQGFPAAAFGVLVAAVLAASLSSISAYVLSASSSIGASMIVKDDSVARQTKVVWVQRVLVVVMALGASVLALQGGLIFQIALFAAAGLGAAFGPLVFASVFSKTINVAGAVSCMVSGLLVVIVWHYSGAGETIIHEVFPGVAVSTAVLFGVSRLTGGASKSNQGEFDKYKASQRGERTSA